MSAPRPPVALTLGIGTAYAADPFTRQPFREWRSPSRSRPHGMPWPVWIDPSGLWAQGPRHWTYAASTELCDHYFASSHGYCLHLTLAANCWLDDHARKIGLGPVRDFALRPWRWQQPEVQIAYETVSLGSSDSVTAGQVASVADIGRTDAEGNELREPTDAESALVAKIHSWDAEAATLLAFGPETPNKRPFVWPVGESDMAPVPDFPFYGRPDPRVYFSGAQHESYEDNPLGSPRRSAKSGQGFIAWQACTDGQMLGSDWQTVARTIHDAPSRPAPMAAFDLRILKTVTLVSGHHREAHGKEQAKQYDIECWQITGTAAKGGGLQHTF